MLVNVNDKKGLGNRLTALITSYRVSEKFNRKFYVKWIKNKECNCELEDLFENNFFKYTQQVSRNIFDKMCYHQNISPIISNTKNDIIFVRSCGFVGCENDKDNIKYDNRFDYPNFSQEFISDFKQYFQLLKPKKDILDILDTFPKSFDVTIHIRLTGNSYGLSDKNKILNEIKNIDKNKTVFICSDNDSIYSEINKIRPIYRYIKNAFNEKKHLGNTDGTNVEMIKDALIDMYLLSRGKIIYASPSSSFCKFSYFISDICNEIKII